MKMSSFYKQAIRTVQFALTALICSVALNFGTAAPSLAAQWQVTPTPHLALFGFGEKAEAKADRLVGKVQAKTGSKLEGRAKSEIGRVEDASNRASSQAGKMSKDIKQGIDKSLSKAGDKIEDTANNISNSVKKTINN